MWKKLATLGLALAWDRFLGEPPAYLHPVVSMGRAISLAIRQRPGFDSGLDFRRGAVLAAVAPLTAFAAGVVAMDYLRRIHPLIGLVGGAFLLKSTFAVSEMEQAARRVETALAENDLPGARAAVSRIVSRDVSQLDDAGVASATVGSIAENTTDSVVGPLMAYAVLGVPGALAYRAISTLDSMVGYRGDMENLGRAAAITDDMVNMVPARLAGAAVVAASAVNRYDTLGALGTMLDEHSRTESPNGGWPIGATAGALGVEIEKVGHYRLGPAGVRPTRTDINRAMNLFRVTAAIAAGVTAWMIVRRR